jgi:hypothetical protein
MNQNPDVLFVRRNPLLWANPLDANGKGSGGSSLYVASITGWELLSSWNICNAVCIIAPWVYWLSRYGLKTNVDDVES